MPLSLADRVAAVTAMALTDMAPVWELASPQDAAEALMDLLPPFIEAWSSAAAALAADWYDDCREELNIGGVFTAIVPEPGDLGAEALAGWAGTALQGSEPDWGLARSRTEGGAQRRIANSARGAVMTSSVADPKARGWKRLVKPGACGFCRMLALRGYKYKSADSATFGAHDHCDCSAVPGWSGGAAIGVRDFTPSEKDITPEQRQATYEWIKENLPIA